jgi:hypothetical protein
VETLAEAITKLEEIKSRGYVGTHRPGPTGIGKTLEDLLGIVENNIDISNTAFAELKSARRASLSMMTLFTRAPLPPRANSKLLNGYGYVTEKSRGRKVLHTTTFTTGYNTLRGQIGFKVNVGPSRVWLVSRDGSELGYWDEPTLKQAFEKKLHHVLYVLADTRGRGGTEEFWFNEVWLLSGFDYPGFATALKEGTVCVDVRIGQFPNGAPHDHGTGFRVLPSKFGLCFKQRQRLL